MQTGVWVVTLEGWCRLFVEDAPEEGQHKFLSVSVKQAGPFKDARCNLLLFVATLSNIHVDGSVQCIKIDTLSS